MNINCFFICSLFVLPNFCVAKDLMATNGVIPNNSGIYSEKHKVCEMNNSRTNADGSPEFFNCQDAISQIVVKNQKSSLPAPDNSIFYTFAVDINFYFTNWNKCDFKSINGNWQNDRIVANSDEYPKCEIKLFFFNNSVHTVANQECSQLCGIRGSLDGAILKKVKNTK